MSRRGAVLAAGRGKAWELAAIWEPCCSKEQKVGVKTREDALSAAKEEKMNYFGFGFLQTGSESAPETAGAEPHLCPARMGAVLQS